MTKKAILAVSFGTTFPETREKTIGATEEALKKAFPGYDLFRAFTSRIVRHRIQKNEGITIDDPVVALDKLADQGYEEVYVQSLHIIPGIEYNLLKNSVMAFQDRFAVLKLTKPLLVSFADFQALTSWMEEEGRDLPAGEGILWMGHGTAHRAFTTYACLDHMLSGTNSYVGAVESYPDVQDEIKRLCHANIKKVYLRPLMMVAGNHAHNDMAADTPHSWKTQLENNGIAVTPVLAGLGESPAIQRLFIDRMKEIMKGGDN